MFRIKTMSVKKYHLKANPFTFRAPWRKTHIFGVLASSSLFSLPLAAGRMRWRENTGGLEMSDWEKKPYNGARVER